MSRAAEQDAPARAFVFPGVGVRLSGHEAAFLERHGRVMTPLLDEASEHAGADLRRALDDEPGLTELQGQLFTYAFDVAVAAAYLDAGATPAYGAGHSMGLYGALATSGALTFAEGLRVVERAYHCVEEAAAGKDGAMAVVVGLGAEEIAEALAEAPPGDTVIKVNANNDTTFVFAGLRADLERFVERAAARDALKARLLPVSAPYHHPRLLAGASDALEGFLRELPWAPARFPIISSIDRRRLTSPEDLIELTARNISTPIDWSAVVRALVDAGVEQLLECGPGISLAQNGRLIEGCPPVVTVKNAARRLAR